MDANGTRFHLLLGKTDWTTRLIADPQKPWAVPPDWDDRFQELTLHRELFQFPATAGARPLVPEDRGGADRDRFGTTYWIDGSTTTILAQSAATGDPTPFWPAAGVAVARFVAPGPSPSWPFSAA